MRRYRSDPYSRYDRGGGYDRYGDRGYGGSRAYDRSPPRGYDRGYGAHPPLLRCSFPRIPLHAPCMPHCLHAGDTCQLQHLLLRSWHHQG